MVNIFYNPTGNPATGAEGLSSLIRAEFAAIAAAFDVMPTIRTTGPFGTVFNQLGNYTFTLPATSGTFALTADVAVEATARGAADAAEATARTAAIAVETTRATAAEGVNATAIGAETVRAIAAEATKQANLGFIPAQQGTGVGQASNNVKIGWSAAAKLKLTIDFTDQGNIAMESWVTPAIAVETTRATAAEGVNATAIGTETARATVAEGVLSTRIVAEVTARSAADTAETTRATAAEGVLMTAIGAETTRATAAGAASIGRNLLHNGLDRIQQRGRGPWTTTGFGADRWFINTASGGSRSVSITSLSDANRSAIGDEAATYCITYQFVGGAGANDFDQIVQNIEDVRSTSGKSVTVSFWARAVSGTPNVGVQLLQYFGTGGSGARFLSSQAVTLSTIWARYTVTFAVPSASGMTIGTGFTSLGLGLWFSAGSTYNTAAAGIGVQANTISIFGRQLEIGTVASPIEKPDIRYDLANCLRYYQPIMPTTLYMAWNAIAGSSLQSASFSLGVTMRSVPTVTPNSWALINCGSPGLQVVTQQAITFLGTSSASGNASFYNDTAISVSAEI